MDQSQISTDSLVISGHAQVMPSNLINEEWQVILSSDASRDDLEDAITRCKELVIQSKECSEERKWLVRQLVEMRFVLRELTSSMKEPHERDSVKVVLGHHFKLKPRGKSLQIPLPSYVPLLAIVGNHKYYCEQCTGIIWTVLQESYECVDCGYLVHQKCIDLVLRVCAHLIVSERNYPVKDICPEIGLHNQKYKCNECDTAFVLGKQIKNFIYLYTYRFYFVHKKYRRKPTPLNYKQKLYIHLPHL